MRFRASDIVDKLRFTKRKRLSLVLQSEAAECGLACLAMVADFHGYASNLLTMRQQFSLTLAGTTLTDLMNFAGRIGLSGRPLRVELEDLTALRTPCILHWDLNHFVVLKSVSSDSIVVHDPARGVRRLSITEASHHFTGVVLELEPTSQFEKRASKPTLGLFDFVRSISGLKRSLTLVLTLSLLLQVFILAAPHYIRLVVDDAIPTRDASLLAMLALGFGVVLLFEIFTSALRGWTLLYINSSMSVQLGASLFHHLIRLPMQFFEKRHMGDVVSRFGSLHQIRQLLTTGFIEAVVDGLMAITTLVMIFYYSTELSIIVVVFVGSYAVFRVATYRTLRSVQEQEIAARAEENSDFMETVRGIQTIKLIGSEARREGQWQNRYVDSTNQTFYLGSLRLKFHVVNRVLFGLENIVVIYLAAGLVTRGSFSVGMLLAFLAYKQQFVGRVSNLIEKAVDINMLNLHLERLADIALSDQEVLHSDRNRHHRVEGRLELEGVSFQYGDGAPVVLSDFSLTVEPGKSIALTGPSGCGKTTILKLMLGLVTPQQGTILVDGVPLERVGKSQYRQQVAAVMQDDSLLSGSIADNIAAFEVPVDMDRIIECAKSAAIHDEIDQMPMGYDSLIGDMGSTLSGGQKQRVILARALYRKPKILFLDEATSHLDTELEASIGEAIDRLKITRVIVAHRIETISRADQVIRIRE